MKDVAQWRGTAMVGVTPGDAGRLPFVPRRVSTHWGGKGPQVDVVAINEDAHGNILGECIWQDTPIGRVAVKAHIESVSKVVPGSLDRWTVYYAFFSKSGFAEEARREMAAKKTFWIDLDDLERALREE